MIASAETVYRLNGIYLRESDQERFCGKETSVLCVLCSLLKMFYATFILVAVSQYWFISLRAHCRQTGTASDVLG